MFAGQGYRDNPINWSLTLGRVFGIRVRMHLLFVLWIVFRFLSDALSEDGSIGVWAVITVFLFQALKSSMNSVSEYYQIIQGHY